MRCTEINELIFDLAAGSLEPSTEIRNHLEGCAACAQNLAEFRQTMTLLDEWRAPEPSPYFDTKLNARLREEREKELARSPGWFAWWRKPALAALATTLVAGGIGIASWRHFRTISPGIAAPVAVVTPTTDAAAEAKGTAVSDLQTLDKDTELYADFDVLDELDSQQNQQVNP